MDDTLTRIAPVPDALKQDAPKADTPKKDSICKKDVDKFLLDKHLATCPVCGRFRSECDVDVHTLSAKRICAPDACPEAQISVLMIVCQSCGAIQFHDRAIVAKWVECQRKLRR